MRLTCPPAPEAPRRPGVVARRAAALAALLYLVGTASAQESLRVAYSVDRGASNRTRVTGQVFNQGRVDVLDVHVTAEALDAGNKVVARGIAFVASSIPQGRSAGFSVTVPAPPNTVRFRVQVTSFRLGLGEGQGP